MLRMWDGDALRVSEGAQAMRHRRRRLARGRRRWRGMTSGTGQQFIAELGAWLNPRLTVEQVRVLRESRTGTYVVRFERPFAREPDVLLVGVPAPDEGSMLKSPGNQDGSGGKPSGGPDL